MTVVTQSRASRVRYLLIAVILAVMTTLGVRALPEATAAERVEVGNFVIEVTDDDQIRYTDTGKGIRYDHVVPPDSQGVTAEQVKSQLTTVLEQIRETFGWDFADAEDRTRANGEREGLSQALHSFDDSALAAEEMTPLRELRDFLDRLEVKECRDRCVDEELEAAGNVIAIVELFSVINKALATLNGDPDVLTKVAIFMVAGLLTGIAEVFVYVVSTLTDIPSLQIQAAAISSMHGLLKVIQGLMAETQDMARENSTTVKKEAQEEAQSIADRSPSEVDTAKDYDMVKDEL